MNSSVLRAPIRSVPQVLAGARRTKAMVFMTFLLSAPEALVEQTSSR
jgi:hypothetical protein